MSHNPPPQPPPWGQPPEPTGPRPYVTPEPPGRRPKWTRKRVLLPAAGLLLFIGAGIGAADDPAQAEKAAEVRSAPRATVTATATETAAPAPAVTETVTASPEPAPTVTETKTVKVTVAPAADNDDTGSGSSGSGSGGGGSVYYKNCTAARAAGAAPVHAGDPGYGPHLDRDGDGVGCE
ncbi:excalibur calcium-binding domain-containing protein [Streptomyces sp. NPDC059092]|uniref:excalibur calcium-binding domain-containing protein n=1 Tax=Streptomyces sp. NPDC059092 TaxID=3346725 RepID=UPI0036B9A252